MSINESLIESIERLVSARRGLSDTSQPGSPIGSDYERGNAADAISSLIKAVAKKAAREINSGEGDES